MRRALLILAALVATACGGGSDSTVDNSSMVAGDSASMEQWQVQLIEADRGFNRAVQTTGLGAWLFAFGSDGMMISGDQTFVGQEGIRQAVLPLFADPEFELTWDPTFATVGPSGDLGYTIGTYEMTTGGEVGPLHETGSYLTVWRRKPNGDWKVEADIGSPAAE